MPYENYRAEKILLVAVFSDIVFKGNVVRQETPKCCDMTIDLIANALRVKFREIVVGGKVFSLLEPMCPVCGKRIPAKYSIIN
jgi:hypothetical protein